MKFSLPARVLLTVALVTITTFFIFMGTAVGVVTESDPKVRWALQLDITRSGLLLQLPYRATFYDYRTDPNNILLWLDLDQATSGNQQTVFVPEGATITVTGELQTWEYGATIDQNFFIYSWTPSWPPPDGYWYGLYMGIPGGYPGETISIDFNLTVPNTPGVYYLYYGSGAEYSYRDALDWYTTPLWVPYAVMTVGSSP